MLKYKIFLSAFLGLFFLFSSFQLSFAVVAHDSQGENGIIRKEEAFTSEEKELSPEKEESFSHNLKPTLVKKIPFSLDTNKKRLPTADSLDKKVSLDFVDANLKDVLKIFTQQTGVNFVIDGGITSQQVSLFLNNVTVRQALKSIAEANGLGFYPIQGTSVLRVSEASAGKDFRVTKIYHLKYANVQRLVLDQTGNGQPSQDSGTSIFKSSDSGSTQGIINAVISVLSEGGIVSIDKRTNSLVVTDYEDRLKRIDQIIQELDKKSDQVLIKAEIVELQDSLNKILGATYGSPNSPKNILSLFYDPPTVAGQTYPFDKNLLGAISPRLTGQDIKTRASEVFLKDTIFGKLSASQFGFILNALKSSSKSKFLARPRLVTLNNEPALVDITSEASINQQTTIDQDTNQTQTSVERTQVGIRLSVTPQINNKEYVTMILQPKVTDIAPSRLFPTMAFDPSTRSVYTKIRIKQGHTISIAGLIHKTFTFVKSKIPILGDIPILGALFTNKSRDERESDLLVFITPYILDDNSMNLLNKQSSDDYAKASDSSKKKKKNIINIFGQNRKNPRNKKKKALDQMEAMSVSKKIQEYERAVQQNPDDPEAHSNLGVAYAKAQKYDLSIESFKNAIMLNPKSATAYNNLGNLYRIKKQYDSAISTLKRAIELFPTHPYAFTTLGLCYEMKGQYDQARHSYQKALQVAPNSSWTNTSRDRLTVLDSTI